MLAATLLGFVFGFVGSMPVAGPIAILVFSRGLEDRLRSGVYLAIGASIAESIYAYFAWWGFSELLTAYPWIETVTRGVAALILVALGIRFSRERSQPGAVQRPPDPNVGNKRSFLLGMTITALNPALMATWGAAVTTLHSLDIVEFAPEHALPFSGGVMLGISTWFCILLGLLHRFRGRFERSTLDRVVRVMGWCLVALGLWFAYRFATGLQEISA